MDLKNCKRCKKVFRYIVGKEICPKCKEKEEECFNLVKDFLQTKPNSSIMEINEATGVSVKQILVFIKEEKIEVTRESEVVVRCDVCRRPICTGVLCPDCKIKMQQNIKDMSNLILSSSKKENTNAKFHTAKKRNKRS